MKKLIIFTGFLFVFNSLLAQIELEKTYNYSGTLVEIENIGYKYYIMDVPEGECRIYNLDHSLYKSINLPLPQNYYLCDIQLLSTNLFDTDAGIELAYCGYRYIETQNSYYYKYVTRVISEEGSIMLDVPDGRYFWTVTDADIGTKYFVITYDYSVFPEIVKTQIYSLPGNLSRSQRVVNPSIETKLFPNPNNGNFNIQYNPDHLSQGAVLEIYDIYGRLLKKQNIIKQTEINLNFPDLTAGEYLYRISSENYQTKAKKFVISGK